MKKLVRSLYFLVKHRMPHTTTFTDLITLQIDNGDEHLRVHKNECAGNASYMSKLSTAEFLNSISHFIDQSVLSRMKKSQFYSIMADESADVSSKEELSICGRWVEDGKAVEHFLDIVRAREVDAQSLTQYLLEFLQGKGLDVRKMRGLGFDGAITMSGAKSGVQVTILNIVDTLEHSWVESSQHIATVVCQSSRYPGVRYLPFIVIHQFPFDGWYNKDISPQTLIFLASSKYVPTFAFTTLSISLLMADLPGMLNLASIAFSKSLNSIFSTILFAMFVLVIKIATTLCK